MATATCNASVLNSALLDSYLGANIADICPHGYTDNSLNHCAHFVSHVLNLSLGSVTCKGMSAVKQADRIGVCIRVHELFAACPELGLYDDCSSELKTSGVLVFVTSPSVVNLQAKRMSNVPKKHIGIGIGDTIWHYSNTKDQVVTATPQAFRKHYSGQTNQLYFGSLPASATASTKGCGR
jgi:hypothetical protein